jgi:hypothetical protein
MKEATNEGDLTIHSDQFLAVLSRFISRGVEIDSLCHKLVAQGFQLLAYLSREFDRTTEAKALLRLFQKIARIQHDHRVIGRL